MKRFLVIFLFVLATSPAYALEAREVVWGYDGKVVPGRFNILSVLLANPTERSHEGMLVLYRTDGMGGRRGANLVRPCFVSPYSSRWVQFYPYVGGEGERWVLKGAGKDVEIPEPRLGAPARVFLSDPDNPFGAAAGFKAFAENLFPSTVTATDGLHSVVVDHAPRWEAPRREAFLDWLRRGGIVHVLRDDRGNYPEFSADLSALNSPLEDFRVGAGRVFRHRLTRRELSDKALAREGFMPAQLLEGDYSGIDKLENGFFQYLGSMTRPEHNWAVIYLIVVAYLVIIVPLNYLFGRKRRKYWLTIIFFLLVVLCFGFTLHITGRRGFGETALVHTISYARPVGEDTYDVAQWTSAFVTGGAYYQVGHESVHNLYSTCHDYEAVKGVIQNGMGGGFRVDMPMYSSRAFHHRGRMKGDAIKLEVVTWKGEGELQELSLRPGPGFPQDMGMWALYEGEFYSLAMEKGLIRISSYLRPEAQSEFLSEHQLMTGEYGYDGYYGLEMSLDDKMRAFEKMVRPLVARGIGGTDAFRYYVDLPARDDRVQIFIFARMPEGFELKKTGFGTETGYVLYHVDVLRPGSEGDTDGRK